MCHWKILTFIWSHLNSYILFQYFNYPLLLLVFHTNTHSIKNISMLNPPAFVFCTYSTVFVNNELVDSWEQHTRCCFSTSKTACCVISELHSQWFKCSKYLWFLLVNQKFPNLLNGWNYSVQRYIICSLWWLIQGVSNLSRGNKEIHEHKCQEKYVIFVK